MAKEIALMALLLIPVAFAIPEKKKVRPRYKVKQRVVDLRPLSQRIREYYERKHEYIQKYYK
jgi:hypothetical protein